MDVEGGTKCSDKEGEGEVSEDKGGEVGGGGATAALTLEQTYYMNLKIFN